jgi:phenol 2-monooxygenase
MAIPREMIENQQYMTRLYTQLEDADAASSISNAIDEQEAKARAKVRRQKVTLPRILDQVKRTMEPYNVEILKVDWWAAYQIGQRVATKFALKDSEDVDRVFIMGDACHTHSPKAGQGMNVSMMDGYNLVRKAQIYLKFTKFNFDGIIGLETCLRAVGSCAEELSSSQLRV